MKRLMLIVIAGLVFSTGCSKSTDSQSTVSPPSTETRYPYSGNPGNSRYPACNWVEPVAVHGEILTVEGFVQVDHTRLVDVRAKEFDGNYFIASQESGGKITPLYADWYDRLSKLVGKRIRITAKVRQMKSGDELQIETLEVLKGTQQ